MNNRLAKRLRSAVCNFAHIEAERRYTTTTVPALGGSIRAAIPLTVKYKAGSQRRMYRDLKRIIVASKAHPDNAVAKVFRSTTPQAILSALM